MYMYLVRSRKVMHSSISPAVYSHDARARVTAGIAQLTFPAETIISPWRLALSTTINQAVLLD